MEKSTDEPDSLRLHSKQASEPSLLSSELSTQGGIELATSDPRTVGELDPKTHQVQAGAGPKFHFPVPVLHFGPSVNEASALLDTSKQLAYHSVTTQAGSTGMFHDSLLRSNQAEVEQSTPEEVLSGRQTAIQPPSRKRSRSKGCCSSRSEWCTCREKGRHCTCVDCGVTSDSECSVWTLAVLLTVSMVGEVLLLKKLLTEMYNYRWFLILVTQLCTLLYFSLVSLIYNSRCKKCVHRCAQSSLSLSDIADGIGDRPTRGASQSSSNRRGSAHSRGTTAHSTRDSNKSRKPRRISNSGLQLSVNSASDASPNVVNSYSMNRRHSAKSSRNNRNSSRHVGNSGRRSRRHSSADITGRNLIQSCRDWCSWIRTVFFECVFRCLYETHYDAVKRARKFRSIGKRSHHSMNDLFRSDYADRRKHSDLLAQKRRGLMSQSQYKMKQRKPAQSGAISRQTRSQSVSVSSKTHLLHGGRDAAIGTGNNPNGSSHGTMNSYQGDSDGVLMRFHPSEMMGKSVQKDNRVHSGFADPTGAAMDSIRGSSKSASPMRRRGLTETHTRGVNAQRQSDDGSVDLVVSAMPVFEDDYRQESRHQSQYYSSSGDDNDDFYRESGGGRALMSDSNTNSNRDDHEMTGYISSSVSDSSSDLYEVHSISIVSSSSDCDRQSSTDEGSSAMLSGEETTSDDVDSAVSVTGSRVDSTSLLLHGSGIVGNQRREESDYGATNSPLATQPIPPLLSDSKLVSLEPAHSQPRGRSSVKRFSERGYSSPGSDISAGLSTKKPPPKDKDKNGRNHNSHYYKNGGQQSLLLESDSSLLWTFYGCCDACLCRPCQWSVWTRQRCNEDCFVRCLCSYCCKFEAPNDGNAMIVVARGGGPPRRGANRRRRKRSKHSSWIAYACNVCVWFSAALCPCLDFVCCGNRIILQQSNESVKTMQRMTSEGAIAECSQHSGNNGADPGTSAYERSTAGILKYLITISIFDSLALIFIGIPMGILPPMLVPVLPILVYPMSFIFNSCVRGLSFLSSSRSTNGLESSESDLRRSRSSNSDILSLDDDSEDCQCASYAIRSLTAKHCLRKLVGILLICLCVYLLIFVANVSFLQKQSDLNSDETNNNNDDSNDDRLIKYYASKNELLSNIIVVVVGCILAALSDVLKALMLNSLFSTASLPSSIESDSRGLRGLFATDSAHSVSFNRFRRESLAINSCISFLVCLWLVLLSPVAFKIEFMNQSDDLKTHSSTIGDGLNNVIQGFQCLWNGRNSYDSNAIFDICDGDPELLLCFISLLICNIITHSLVSLFSNTKRRSKFWTLAKRNSMYSDRLITGSSELRGNSNSTITNGSIFSRVWYYLWCCSHQWKLSVPLQKVQLWSVLISTMITFVVFGLNGFNHHILFDFQRLAHDSDGIPYPAFSSSFFNGYSNHYSDTVDAFVLICCLVSLVGGLYSFLLCSDRDLDSPLNESAVNISDDQWLIVPDSYNQA